MSNETEHTEALRRLNSMRVELTANDMRAFDVFRISNAPSLMVLA